MELLLICVRLVEWLFVAPVWWAASMLAGIFYPYEGDRAHMVLALVFSLLIGGGAIWLLWFLL